MAVIYNVPVPQKSKSGKTVALEAGKHKLSAELSLKCVLITLVITQLRGFNPCISLALNLLHFVHTAEQSK